MRAPIWILLPALSLAPAPLPAQGTISDDDAAFVRGTLAFGGTPNADFVGVSVPGSEDHVFQTGWWFRLTGATQESPAGAPTSQQYVGDTSSTSTT